MIQEGPLGHAGRDGKGVSGREKFPLDVVSTGVLPSAEFLAIAMEHALGNEVTDRRGTGSMRKDSSLRQNAGQRVTSESSNSAARPRIMTIEQAIKACGIPRVSAKFSLERILEGFDFKPDRISARYISSANGHAGGPRIQVREELGVSEMHRRGRPDNGRKSFLEAIISLHSQVDVENLKNCITSLQAQTAQHEIWMFHKRAFALFSLGDYAGARKDAERVISAIRILNQLDFPTELHTPQFVISLAKAWMIRGQSQLRLVASQNSISWREKQPLLEQVANETIGNIRELAPGPFGRFNERSRREAMSRVSLELENLKDSSGNVEAVIPDVSGAEYSIAPTISRFAFIPHEIRCRLVGRGLRDLTLQVRTPLGVSEISTIGSPDGGKLWDGKIFNNGHGSAAQTCQAMIMESPNPLNAHELDVLDYGFKIFRFRARIFRKALNWDKGAIDDEAEALRIIGFAFSHSPSGEVRYDLLDKGQRQELHLCEMASNWFFGLARYRKALETAERALNRVKSLSPLREQGGLPALEPTPIYRRLFELREEARIRLEGPDKAAALRSRLRDAVSSEDYREAQGTENLLRKNGGQP